MLCRSLLAALSVAIATLGSQPARADSATCVLEVAGKSYIDGSCDHQLLTDGKGSFQFGGADGRYFAYVYVDGDRATAHWNGASAERRAHDPLGELRRDGDCWVNDGARICVSASSAKSGAASGEPFGTWNCDGLIFSVDAKSYEMSGRKTKISKIERISDDAWGFELKDGYRIALFDVTAKSLTWHSPASGDTFECRKTQ